MRNTVLALLRWLMTSTCFLLMMALAIAALSAYASWISGQWHWFQRSGALLVSIGAVLSTRRLLRAGLDGMIAGISYFEMANRIDADHGPAQQRESRRDLLAAYWGFWTVGCGTLIWAYGDLVACLLAWSLRCTGA